MRKHCACGCGSMVEPAYRQAGVTCGISTVVVRLLPKQETPVQFWYPAQINQLALNTFMANEEIGKFGVVAAAVIINDMGQVLLTQRALDREHHPGEWEILSGRLNQGEGFEEGLKREANEELKIEISIIGTLNAFHFFRGEEKEEHVGVAFLVRHAGGEVIVDGVEEVAYAWFDFPKAIRQVKDESIKGNLVRAEQYLKSSSGLAT